MGEALLVLSNVCKHVGLSDAASNPETQHARVWLAVPDFASAIRLGDSAGAEEHHSVCHFCHLESARSERLSSCSHG